MDTDVIIKCRLQDQTLAVAAIERASFEYKKLTKRDIKVALDESRFLPDST